MADELVVLPTPPFPPTKTNLRSSLLRPMADQRRESRDIVAGLLRCVRGMNVEAGVGVPGLLLSLDVEIWRDDEIVENGWDL